MRNQKLNPAGHGKPVATHGLTGTEPGLVLQEAAGLVFGRFWNSSEQCVWSKPGPVARTTGASHYVCNGRSSFSMFKKLSLHIVTDLRDNNSVTALHISFIDVILGYQFSALHSPTLPLSLLLIHQKDLVGHTTMFPNGTCSITSPCFCNLTGKLINGIYIIVRATSLLSSTTKKTRNKDSSLPIAEASIESSIARITA